MLDAHCHIYDEKLNDCRKELLENLSRTGQICICSSDNIENSKKSVDLANKYDFIYATVGTHPHEVKDFKDDDLKIYENMLKNKKVVAVGEIGLDYYYDKDTKEKQKEVLLKQIAFADKMGKPCVFHIREATEDFVNILKENKRYFNRPSMIHSFSGSVQTAKFYLDMGFYISINGIATFKNAGKILDVIAFVPLDRLLIETDSPYLTPVPHRGEANRPEYVYFVAEKIAQIKGLSVEEVISKTEENAKKLFGIK